MASYRTLLPLLVVICGVGCGTSKQPPAATSAGSSTASSSAPSANLPNLDNTGNALDLAGVPRYPGSTVVGTASTPGDAGSTKFSVMSSTPDSSDKVVQFYKDSTKVQSAEREGITKFVWRTAKGADIILDVRPDGKATKIMVTGILYK